MSDPTTPELPRELQLEVTGACNLSCAMCLVRYRPKLGRKSGSMSLARFREIVDALPELERLTLQGLGEPLLAPDLLAMVEYATARDILVGFNTNGMLLDPATSERLVEARLGWLHVSIDGGTAETYESIREGARLGVVEANVRALVDAIRKRRADRPRLSLVYVAMRRNLSELPGVVRLAADWGIPRLRVQNLSHSFSDTDAAGRYAEIRAFAETEALWPSSGDEVERVFEAARREASALGVELRLPETSPEPAARRPLGTPGCDWPWRSGYVTHGGEMQPCCMVMGADRAVLGRLDEAGFEAVWSGDAYRSFRERLLTDDPPEVCRGCAAYRGVF